ncbi:related to Translation initiation factor IF-2, mitochondrial [Saccharomycodes ludwigii]|uniref:Translation initiation factor IF-2, mitochondrial n=1 Tax=Saccharomycodes ludwigii TaxID=36035 RepID=A0A376B4S7_9ASCO|nr:related to Translation initiation factor IF-2, mitochondrial [Saccharomycodes ludwigii]
MLSKIPLKLCNTTKNRAAFVVRYFQTYKFINNIATTNAVKKRDFHQIPFTLYNANRRFKAKKKNRDNKPKPISFVIPNYTSVSNLANLLNVKIDNLIKDLTKLGFKSVSHKYILNKEYIELILQEYNYELPNNSNTAITSENCYDEIREPINPTKLASRPPIVTIMGHVDHGKTTILDFLQKTSIVSKEHGGITQHIGAFQVITPKSKQKITFLDTPGHAAFLKMRERGCSITDIVVLVISIEDSIMPQTMEAIKHIKKYSPMPSLSAEQDTDDTLTPLIVAITKIDKISNTREREAKINKISNDLIVQGIPIEKIGGDVQVIPVSANTGENMDTLEEGIVLLSEMMDLKAEQESNYMEGWILESQMKKSLGNVATILIKRGQLRKGNILLCGSTYCKVRNLLDSNGLPVLKALPSEAVEVIGWKELPVAGSDVLQVKNESVAKKYISKRQNLLEIEAENSQVDKLNEEIAEQEIEKRHKKDQRKTEEEYDAENDDEDVKDNDSVKQKNTSPRKLSFIIKADVSGSVEAIIESISHIGNDEVKTDIISSSVGLPTESDLKMARITNAKILCFNLGHIPTEIINNKYNIEVRQYTVIYKLIEDVIQILTDNLKPIYEDKKLATVEIRDIFNFTLKKKIIKIAGCRVINGKIQRNSLVKIIRNDDENNVVFEGKLSSLRQGKEDASEITKGQECGITFDNGFEGYEANDKIIVYERVKVPRFL